MEALHEEVHVKDPKTIVLLGKTGNGKSATGNTLLQKNVFEEISSDNLCIKLLTRHNSDDLVVYDTRGPFDEATTFDKSCLNTTKELKKTMENCFRVDAFVLVLNSQARFTIEERETVNLYKNVLGQKFMKTNGIIVLTRGDKFNSHGEFQEWCDQQTGYFKELIKECNNRFVLFNNKGDTTQKSHCRAELLEKMMTINSGYTIANFDENSVIRDNYFAKLSNIEFKSYIKDKIGKLKLILYELTKSNERCPQDINVLLAEIIKEKHCLNNVKTKDEPLNEESRDLEELYQKAENLKQSKCVIQ